MGAVFQGPDAPPRARYTMRLRRALPALAFLVVLCALAGVTWLRVLDRVDDRTAAAACGTTTADLHKVQLRVYNATAREGLAKKIASVLNGRGYAIVSTDNDPLAGIRPVEGTAEIRYGPSGAKQATLVRRQVPGATLYKDARQDAVVDLVLGQRFSRLATAAELARGRQGLVAAPATAPAKAESKAAAKGGATPAPKVVASPTPAC
jgi:LytR cell envelope-related transcriptional attenuator